MYSTDTLKLAVNRGYLHITGSRLLNNYPSVLAFTNDICKAIENKNTCKLILIDYSNFISIITYADIFNIIRVYDLRMDFCRTIRLSVIVDMDEIEIAKYWESLCEKRGFTFKVFLSFEEGEKWLLGFT